MGWLGLNHGATDGKGGCKAMAYVQRDNTLAPLSEWLAHTATFDPESQTSSPLTREYTHTVEWSPCALLAAMRTAYPKGFGKPGSGAPPPAKDKDPTALLVAEKAVMVREGAAREAVGKKVEAEAVGEVPLSQVPS